jgi:putative acetyltransferase
MVTIRKEQLDDIDAVHVVNERAFGQSTEAVIVDSIRAACPEAVSLVALDGNQVVGHILFSPVFASGEKGSVQGMGLGPMAVVPERQGQGIGSMLVRTGIETMRERDCPFIIVIGYPEYYPRFGFRPASQYGLSCQWDGVPDNTFMALVLDEGAMARVSGIVRYRDEFDVSV